MNQRKKIRNQLIQEHKYTIFSPIETFSIWYVHPCSPHIRYKYRKFMKHIENWLASNPFLDSRERIRAHASYSWAHNCGPFAPRTNTHTHTLSCLTNSTQVWFTSAKYVYNWLNRYTHVSRFFASSITIQTMQTQFEAKMKPTTTRSQEVEH